MILKCYFSLNYNENLKLIFTDVPITNEIDYIINNVLKDDITTKEFFFYSKLNLLFEKYLWLSEECKNRCPSCSSYLDDSAHLTADDLMREYVISRNDNYVVESICNKIFSATNAFQNEHIILTFVETQYFHQVIQKVCKQLDKIVNPEIKPYFDLESKVYTFNDDKEINKFGIALNVLGKSAKE